LVENIRAQETRQTASKVKNIDRMEFIFQKTGRKYTIEIGGRMNFT
jgi:hypothetical protein